MPRRTTQVCLAFSILATFLLVSSLPVTAPPTVQPEQQAPYLIEAIHYDYDKLMDTSPYGRFNLKVFVKKLVYDNNPTYDSYIYEIQIQTIPGKALYGSNWRTRYTWAEHYGVFGSELDSYGPYTTVGQTTASVNLVVSASPGFGITWTYSVKDVEVRDLSDTAEERASWQHIFNPVKAAATGTFTVTPGFVIRTASNDWSCIDAVYKVEWWRPQLVYIPFVGWTTIWFSYVQESDGLVLDAFLSGDVRTKITIQSQPTTDYYLRSHGKSIDSPLPLEGDWNGPWWPPYNTGYEFLVTDSAFNHEQIHWLVYGSHYVDYAASGYVPGYAWHAKIYINDVLKAEGDVGRFNRLRANFAV